MVVRRRPPAFFSEQPSLSAGPEIHGARHLRAGLLAHQIGEPARQLALVGAWEGAVEHVGDDQAEHVVAEEFQALIAVGAVAAGRARRCG